MKVAIILEETLSAGGGFQQALSTILILQKYQGKNSRFQFYFYSLQKSNIQILSEHGVKAKPISYSAFDKLIASINKTIFVTTVLAKLRIRLLTKFERILMNDAIQLVYFLSPSTIATSLMNLGFMITVWDLCHRDHPEFPEVSYNKEFEKREHLFQKGLPKAVAILTDSEQGRKNVLTSYGCHPDRVRVARFLPAATTNTLKNATTSLALDLFRTPYIFYPAQFWAHKNHIYIIDALRLLKYRHRHILNVVFTGSDKGNLRYILDYAKKYEVIGQIKYLGFVSNYDLMLLYKHALALVMPTYFGQTNIPPLEAFVLGCPVCYSDLPGLREQVGEAAFFLDLNRPESLAEAILTIQTNSNLVQQKIEIGKKLVTAWTENDYWKVVEDILTKFAIKRKTWE